ncbi:unnamed protein product [Onchocerca flexuosa]|uniref:Unspecific monooxygenase n=1 Tax=Onchocerca flexuosa TaxID=387005 RepID=A0A183H992_9BILA|nr:unnamed protein product [Onchocerca flexuosa]
MLIIAICTILGCKTRISFIYLPIPPSLVLLVAAYIFYDLRWKGRLLPPGPTPWLFFGNILHFMFYESIDDMFLTWKQKYGKGC